jgi:glycosyltransferase involved in cell wall biosynthesis
VVTYNQEKYIAQCLQSLVDQETDFPFEIIVGDDCSTDGTRAIVSNFATQYPNIIRPVLREKNIGPAKNYIDVHSLARGDYVAHVDGDDYVLPKKLSRQAWFMDINPSCRISGHDVAFLGDDGKLEFHRKVIPSIASAELFLTSGNFLVHSSTMYRSEFSLSDGIDSEAIDFQMHVDRVGDGCIGYISEVLGVYRVVSGGLVSHYYRSTKMFYKNVSAIYAIDTRKTHLVHDAIYNLAFNWIKNLVAVGSYDLALDIFSANEVGVLNVSRRLKLGLLIAFGPLVAIALKINRSKL